MNNVCFCFPLPFLPFPPATSVCSRTAARVSTSPPAPAPTTMPPECPFPFPLQTDVAGGATSPKICLNDAFPLTDGFALGWAVGSSGNAASDNAGGCTCLAAPPVPFFLGDIDIEGGAYVVAAEEPLAEDAEAHGVCRCGWRNAGVAPTPEGPARAGNRLTWTALDDVEGGVLAPGTARNVEDDALAACATRSHTCREDC